MSRMRSFIPQSSRLATSAAVVAFGVGAAAHGQCCSEKAAASELKAQACDVSANACDGEIAFDLASRRFIEDQANSHTSSLQSNATLAMDIDGNMLVAWGSRRQEHGSYGVFAQRFDPLGRRLGTEIHVNQRLRGAQRDPAIAYDAHNTAWLVWESTGQDGDSGGIYARRFKDTDGELVPMSDEFQINCNTEFRQYDPSISASEDGRLLVTWSTLDANDKASVRARVFHPCGSAAGAEFELVNGIAGTHDICSSAALNDGRFVTVWAHKDENNMPNQVLGRIIGADGQPEGDAFVINDNAKHNIEPSVDADADGRFVVAWMGSRCGDGYDVLARQFDASGTPAGESFKVADGSTWQSGASVAMADNGRFVVSYNIVQEHAPDHVEFRPSPQSDIFAQVFSSNGERLGETFRVNQHDEGAHLMTVASNTRQIVWGDNDQLAFAWDGNAGLDGSGTALTVIAPEGFDVPAPAPVDRLAVAFSSSSFDGTVPDRVPIDTRGDTVDIQAEGPDFGFQSFNTTVWQPPDPSAAVGPNHVVSVVNMSMNIHTKDGTLLFSDLFENMVNSGNFIFDPVAYYDQWDDRYVVAIAEHNGSADILHVWVSQSSDPVADGWYFYIYNVDSIGGFVDFENLGIGEDYYYISADYFGGGGNNIAYWEKAPLLNGTQAPTQSRNTNSSLISLGASKSYDSNGHAYFASSYASGSTSMRLYALNPLTNGLSQFDVSVPFYNQPPDATQMGSSNRLDTIDYRVKHGVVRNGSAWFTHTVGEDNTARTRWYEFDLRGWPTSGNNPTLAQSGTLNYGNGEHNWYADIGVTDDNDVVIVHNRSSSSDFVYVARTVRKAGDPLGTFRESVRMKESSGAHTGGRWGDYGGVDEDPTEPGVFYSHHEYSTGSTNWRTWVGVVDSDQSMVLDIDQLIVGQQTNMTVSGATPNRPVYYAYSTDGLQDTFVPALNVTVDLQNGILAGTVQSNGSGVSVFSFTVPNGAPRGDVWIQAAQQQNTSNVVQEFIN